MHSRPKNRPGDDRASVDRSGKIHPRNGLDRMSAKEIVRLMNREDHKVATVVQRELPAIARAVDGIVKRLQQGGRLIYVGSGTSGRIARTRCFGMSANLRHPPAASSGALIAGGEKADERSGGRRGRPAAGCSA